MENTLCIILLLIGIVKADLNPLSDEFIELINAQQSTWKAGRNFHPETSLHEIKRLMGVVRDTVKHPNMRVLKTFDDAEFTDGNLPENFDPRQKWPNCPSLNEIRDQGCCGSGWAFGAVSAMTDRVCIQSNQTKNFHFSAENLLACSNCGSCETGGDHFCAWYSWFDEGIVSGGNYKSGEGCRPYTIPNNSTQNPCIDFRPTPPCVKSCQKGYDVDYLGDKHYGKDFYAIGGIERFVKTELFSRGPVEVSFTVYEDFLSYKSGVYQHVHGSALGDHAVKLMGWGVENGVKYWLLANSWNTSWGDGGFFKFLRGKDHCGIADNIVAGNPRF